MSTKSTEDLQAVFGHTRSSSSSSMISSSSFEVNYYTTESKQLEKELKKRRIEDVNDNEISIDIINESDESDSTSLKIKKKKKRFEAKED